MDARLIARVVAAGRVAIGVALLVAPDRVTVPWVGPVAATPAARVIARGLGARDVVLGAGTLASDEGGLPLWLAAAVAADTADLVSTLAAGGAVPARGRALVGALAGAGAGLGAVALIGARRAR